ncbi:MAG: hypothetical protein RL375_1965 [Pseudomonadota bacterium]|jgi:hypothetical protein
MNHPSYFASLISDGDRSADGAADDRAPVRPLDRDQADRLAHLFRLSLRAGQIHPLAHLVEVHLARKVS